MTFWKLQYLSGKTDIALHSTCFISLLNTKPYDMTIDSNRLVRTIAMNSHSCDVLDICGSHGRKEFEYVLLTGALVYKLDPSL